MSSDFKLIETPYVRDILDGPSALRRCVGGLEATPALDDLRVGLGDGRFARVVITGMGGSLATCYPAQLKLIDAGIHALSVETAELVHYMPRLLDARSILVVVSQSGASGEIVRLLAQSEGRPRLVGVTNTADSPLGNQAHVTVLMNAGPETSVSCKTSLTSLAALEWVADALCGRDLRDTRSDLEQAAPAAERYLASWREHVEALCREWRGVEHILVAGRGASHVAAALGGMIGKEAAHLHSEGMTCPQVRHGAIEMLGPKTAVLVLEGHARTAALNLQIARDLRATGARTYVVGPSSEVPALRLPVVSDAVRPIVELLAVQLMSLALAALAGREPGKFDWLTKVTTVE